MLEEMSREVLFNRLAESIFNVALMRGQRRFRYVIAIRQPLFFRLQDLHTLGKGKLLGQEVKVAQHFIRHNAEAFKHEYLPAEVQAHSGDAPRAIAQAQVRLLDDEMTTLV